MDAKGYFLIRFDRDKKIIELGQCKFYNIIEFLIKGKTPQEVYFTACKKGLLSRLEHVAYSGKELEKAYLTLKYNFDYVQDEELKVNR